jgi:hypothetical protein
LITASSGSRAQRIRAISALRDQRAAMMVSMEAGLPGIRASRVHPVIALRAE